MQTILVIITFLLAAGYLVKKFAWTPIFENRQKLPKSVDGGNAKCGKKDCGCH